MEATGGSGLWWGPLHPWNETPAAEGPEQGNQRAELCAIRVALAREGRPMEIRSDSM